MCLTFFFCQKFTRFEPPFIPSAGVYFFTTDIGIRYELRFGRKQSDILSATIVFGVLNEEFEGEEYVLVNRGEIFSVMNTIESIFQDFFLKNPNIHTFEFSGEPLRPSTSTNLVTKRTRVYMRYARKIFSEGRLEDRIEGQQSHNRKKAIILFKNYGILLILPPVWKYPTGEVGEWLNPHVC